MRNDESKALRAPDMTAAEIKEARHALGLSVFDCANLSGIEGPNAQTRWREIERGDRFAMPAHRRLLLAYLAGYRPPDWPL